MVTVRRSTPGLHAPLLWTPPCSETSTVSFPTDLVGRLEAPVGGGLLSWSQWRQSGVLGFLCFSPVCLTPSFLPSPAPIYRHLDLWPCQLYQLQRRGDLRFIPFIIPLLLKPGHVSTPTPDCHQLDYTFLSFHRLIHPPACLPVCQPGELHLVPPTSLYEPLSIKPVTFNYYLCSPCFWVLTKTPPHNKKVLH